MKRLFCLLICFALVMLPGCGAEPETPQTPETTQPTEEKPSLTGEDILYFRNPQEYDQLYAYDASTGETALILPGYTYNVRRQENAVYYTCDSGLYAYDLSDRSVKLINEYAYDYCFVDGGLVYCFYHANWNTCTLFYYDVAADTHTVISDAAYTEFASYGDSLYYFEMVDENEFDMRLYSVRENSSSLLRPDIHGMDVTAGPSGVYLYNYENYDTPHIYVDGTTGKATILYTLLGKTVTPLCMTEKGLYYKNMDSADGHWSYETYCLSSDGTNTLLLQEDPGMIVGEANGNLLFCAADYIYWGPEDEYGYGENVATCGSYYLLDKEGNIKPVQVKGESSKLFANGDFPLIDSSTARKPVTAALYSLFVKGYGYDGKEPVCSTTHGAWVNIADRTVDLALLAAPTEEEKAYLTEKNVEVEMKLYGGDGLVFMTNGDNPVTDLTHEQILGIYTGQITNWSQVGGPDHPIVVYYRDDQSGSQRLFESLVFKGMETPDYAALGFFREDEMSSIVDIIGYQEWAVGYSIMTYLDSVYENDSVKILSVDGVIPSPETVASSTYRYHTKGYVVIRADEPEDSPARRLYNWFGSPTSDDLLTCCGVSPLSE